MPCPSYFSVRPAINTCMSLREHDYLLFSVSIKRTRRLSSSACYEKCALLRGPGRSSIARLCSAFVGSCCLIDALLVCAPPRREPFQRAAAQNRRPQWQSRILFKLTYSTAGRYLNYSSFLAPPSPHTETDEFEMYGVHFHADLFAAACAIHRRLSRTNTYSRLRSAFGPFLLTVTTLCNSSRCRHSRQEHHAMLCRCPLCARYALSTPPFHTHAFSFVCCTLLLFFCVRCYTHSACCVCVFARV